MELRGQDRRKLDARRLGAVLVDLTLFVPIELLAMQYDIGAQLLFAALWLAYFFLCDATTGQTVGKALLGLRTVTLDGEIASPGAASRRTVLRLLDHTVIGLLALVLTGGRRQRLGDLAAGTVVVRAGDVDPIPGRLTPRLLAWPALWLAPALVLFVLSAEGRIQGTYRADADAVCAGADRIMRDARTPTDVVVVMERLTDALAALDAPANWRARHEALLAEATAVSTEAAVITARARRSADPARSLRRSWPRLEAQVAAANQRIAALGFQDCSAGA